MRACAVDRFECLREVYVPTGSPKLFALFVSPVVNTDVIIVATIDIATRFHVKLSVFDSKGYSSVMIS